jgi:hypothetical protein
MVADGLGHGAEAAAASRAALALLAREAHRALETLVDVMHDQLRTTRGAAVTLAAIDTTGASIEVCAVGNVVAQLVSEGHASGFTSAHGTIGANLRQPVLVRRAWPSDALLIVASDGVRPRWQPEELPGLWLRDPALVAGTLYAAFATGSDDATVLAVRA